VSATPDEQQQEGDSGIAAAVNELAAGATVTLLLQPKKK
jgi:hypothetical protein